MNFIKVTSRMSGEFYLNADKIIEILPCSEVVHANSDIILVGATGLFHEYVKEFPKEILKQL